MFLCSEGETSCTEALPVDPVFRRGDIVYGGVGRQVLALGAEGDVAVPARLQPHLLSKHLTIHHNMEMQEQKMAG